MEKYQTNFTNCQSRSKIDHGTQKVDQKTKTKNSFSKLISIDSFMFMYKPKHNKIKQLKHVK